MLPKLSQEARACEKLLLKRDLCYLLGDSQIGKAVKAGQFSTAELREIKRHYKKVKFVVSPNYKLERTGHEQLDFSEHWR
jgi:hypothetical protein